ncbi:hypothetical protein [uncultured Xylophilus sp.]|uniref:hypothetical protein n=1 Tax=uncultured Xylophilus sp. TaxID=296832 RepID=UPI0025E91AC2|nr:hypothetical protein [uncultured Xylophilus sp.]
MRTAVLTFLAVCALQFGPGLQPAHADAAELRARYDSLRPALRRNDFQRPMVIESTEQSGRLQGDVFAVLDYPFQRVVQGLSEPALWCDVLILPFNTKYCRARGEEGGPAMLDVRIGRRADQPAEQAYRLSFTWQKAAATDDYSESRVTAPTGPLGTKDYRISVEAIPLDGGRSFMHLRYAYASGVAGRLAMQAYLATAGADKIGFSVVGQDVEGRPQRIGGVRGAVERNAMRYYLAVDTALEALAVAPEARRERRIQQWFTATERYPEQLHEMDRATYVAMKRREYERQQQPMD